MTSPDVLVVGGGAIGASVAYELARAGARVTVLERDAAPGGGCSYGNAGLICPSHAQPLPGPLALRQGPSWVLRRDSPLHMKPRPALVPWLARFARASTAAQAARGAATIRSLSLRSLERHAALADTLDTGFVQAGLLNVYETEEGLSSGREEARANAADGLAPAILSDDEARERAPGLRPGLAGAIHYERDAHCDPGRFVTAVTRAAVDAGATVRTGVEAFALRRRGRRVEGVETTVGVETAGEVVLAAGSWTPELARGVLFVPVEAGKGYHVELPAPPEPPAMPVISHEARIVLTPLPGRMRVAGTLDLTGLDMAVDPARVDALVRAAGRIMPALAGARVRGVWRGLRPCAPDGLPIVGRTERLDNLILATAHAMMGLTLAPLTGDVVADLVRGRAPEVDTAPLRPDRFRALRQATWSRSQASSSRS